MDAGTPPGEIQRFSKALSFYPAGFIGNRLNLMLVNDGYPILDSRQYLKQVSHPSLMDERREYSIIDQSHWPFPVHEIGSRPDERSVSDALFENFDLAAQILIKQQDIGEIIEDRVQATAPNIVLLMIVDGLSYYDLPASDETLPCLVTGVSTTQYGYRAVVGKPQIARRLFTLGYKDMLAFSYYQPDGNDLSYDLHEVYSPSEFQRVKEFDEVIKRVKHQKMYRGYIQVISMGLDHLSHHHPDRPPIDHYLKQVIARFDEIVDLLHKRFRSVLACLTADHGILWRDKVESHIKVASDLYQEDIYHPRYLTGAIYRPYSRHIKSLGQSVSLLGYPWMTRNFRNDEWGVHGGISAWESLVPLIIRQL
jgi:hypothetical protein